MPSLAPPTHCARDASTMNRVNTHVTAWPYAVLSRHSLARGSFALHLKACVRSIVTLAAQRAAVSAQLTL
eukprot:1512478-Pleurochrysis_carterae.AAC.1